MNYKITIENLTKEQYDAINAKLNYDKSEDVTVMDRAVYAIGILTDKIAASINNPSQPIKPEELTLILGIKKQLQSKIELLKK